MKSRVFVLTAIAFVLAAGVFGTPEATAQTGLDRHLVLFKGNGVPKGFTEDVEALGGSVVFTHKVGIGIVQGLTDEAAAELGANKKVSAVEPDVAFPLDPGIGGNLEAVERICSSVAHVPRNGLLLPEAVEHACDRS